MEILSAPWRYKYVSSMGSVRECIFCSAGKSSSDDENLVLARGEHNFILLNKYPYTNGHLMVAPYRHLAEPAQACPAERSELLELCTVATGILKEAYAPDGFNVGMNIGRVAGAGIESHYHMHVVPRWSGDANFISVIGAARVIPEEPEQSWRRLHPMFARSLGERTD